LQKRNLTKQAENNYQKILRKFFLKCSESDLLQNKLHTRVCPTAEHSEEQYYTHTHIYYQIQGKRWESVTYRLCINTMDIHCSKSLLSSGVKIESVGYQSQHTLQLQA